MDSFPEVLHVFSVSSQVELHHFPLFLPDPQGIENYMGKAFLLGIPKEWDLSCLSTATTARMLLKLFKNKTMFM